MTQDEVLALYQQHQSGVTCAEISRQRGMHRDWAAVLFKRHGLAVRSASATNTMLAERAPKKVKIPRDACGLPDGYYVRLVIRDGVYHIVLHDAEGERISAGVPASVFEVCLWRELKHYLGAE
jgi:hypothetical protein